MPELQNECPALIPSAWAWRSTRLKLAVLASIGSKFVTVLLQLLVLPMAVRALGAERYGVYVMLASCLSWITLVGTSIAPSLTIGIAAARGDNEAEARYLTSALCIVGIVCALILAALGALLWHSGVTGLFGARYLAYTDDIYAGLLVLTGALLVQLLLVVVEGVQGGYQELHIVGVCAMLGQVLATVTLAAVIACRAQSIVNLILCLCVVAFLPRLCNGLVLIGHVRRHLWPRPRHFSPRLARALVGTGMAFSLAGLGQFLRQDGSVVLVGRLLGPGPVAGYALMLYLTLLASGIVTMQLGPLLPAITDAMAGSDLEWVRWAWRRTMGRNMAFALAVGAGLALAGPALVRLWYGPALAPSGALSAAVGIAFILQTWEVSHHTVLFGLGCLWPPAVAFVLQNVVALALCVPLVTIFGSTGAAGAFCLTSLAWNSWYLPYLLRKKLSAC
ncbi:MAG: oligosaccharide flippase family protein [Planctomycetaceae bacterium]|nr:oligosaccharide flippase family protein [Planctomycetaceae bacterium]